jgi:hypothetical protein
MRWCVVAALSLLACSKIEESVAGGPQVLRSADGTLEITVPGGFKVDKLNDQAAIQAANRMGELYVVVVSEPKEDLSEMTLQKLSDVARGTQLRSMKDSKEEGPVTRTINGRPALEYTLSGSVEGANVVMKHVVIEGSRRWHQILVWTLRSKWEAEKGTLDNIVASLREVGS